MVISEYTMELLTAISVPGIGPAKLRGMIKNQDDMFQSSFLSGIDPSLIPNANRKAQDIIEICIKHGINIISIYDDDYPIRLKEILDYPPILYYKGNKELFRKKCAAVVGKRKASDYGREISFRISSRLSQKGICIVSGLALGIDTEAHRGCLSVGGYTVAILAHGLDQITPSSNIDLAEKILEANGMLLSEHPPGIKMIIRSNYIERNRIQSGMSECSILVESGKAGGSIQQAKYTFTQNRKLFAVLPKHPNATNSDFDITGALHLMDAYGATPIYSKDDYSLIEMIFQSQ